MLITARERRVPGCQKYDPFITDLGSLKGNLTIVIIILQLLGEVGQYIVSARYWQAIKYCLLSYYVKKELAQTTRPGIKESGVRFNEPFVN